LELWSSKAFEARNNINSFRPQATELLSFVKSDKRKVTKEKRFLVNQGPARAVLPRACATRDILSRWRTAHIHVRRPSGVLLFSRVTSLAALDELRDSGKKSTTLSRWRWRRATAIYAPTPIVYDKFTP
jgi:hypothetical protein